MHIHYLGRIDPVVHLLRQALPALDHTLQVTDEGSLDSLLQNYTSRVALLEELKQADLLIAQNTGLLWAKLSGRPYLWLPGGPDAANYAFSKSWMSSWLSGQGEALLLGPIYREAIIQASAAFWIAETSAGLKIESTEFPLQTLLKWHAQTESAWIPPEYQKVFTAAFANIDVPVDGLGAHVERCADPHRLAHQEVSAQFAAELGHLIAKAASKGSPHNSQRIFVQHDDLVDAAITDANSALSAGDLAQVLTALESGFDLVGWEPRLVSGLATVLDFAGAKEQAVGVLETALVFYPGENEIQKMLDSLKAPKSSSPRISFSSNPGGLKLLYVGNSSADYLAKCHEAFRTGMRAVLNMRMFGQGYEGYRSDLKTFQEIVDYVYPEEKPDIVFADYAGSAHPMDFPYDGLSELNIPKVIGVGDFWEVTEKHFDEFVANLEKYRISVVQWYFPQPIQKMNSLPYANILVPVAVDPTIFNDWGEPKRYDVGFLAAGTVDYTDFYPERWLIHQALLQQSHISYLWAAHPGWERTTESRPLVGQNFSRAINSCRMFITTGGKYRNPHAKYVEILASKSMLLADEPHGADLLGLEDGVNYVKITTENFLEKINYYLARPELCDEIAENGYRLALRKHSCYARAVDFLDQISRPDIVQKIRALR